MHRYCLTSVAVVACLVLLAFVTKFGLAVCNLFALEPSVTANSKLQSLPPVILWAWERPEDLSFIDTRKTGVAFLAKTIFLRGDKVLSRPRLQPLKLADSAKLIAVTRIESDRTDRPTLAPEQLKQTVFEITALTDLPNISAIQIDFDATVSEREFYRQLLFNLRSELSESVPISITALASWCLGDNWLTGLPIDEAVPMLFRMGVDRNQILAHLSAGEMFASKPCQASIGISTDEPFRHLPVRGRVYVFNPASWSGASVQKLMEEYD